MNVCCSGLFGGLRMEQALKLRAKTARLITIVPALRFIRASFISFSGTRLLGLPSVKDHGRIRLHLSNDAIHSFHKPAQLFADALRISGELARSPSHFTTTGRGELLQFAARLS